MSDQIEIVAPEPRGILSTLDELLRRPMAGFVRARSGAPVGPWALRVCAGSIVCCVLYGAAGGFFQGGAQVAVAAIKAPLIIVLSAALCMPSLYVLSTIGGAALTRERFVVTLAAFFGLLGLILVALLPIEWLFSVSSRSLAFVVWLHVALWGLAVSFGGRFLRAALPELSGGVVLLWLMLFCVVSFQVTTFVRPTLWRAPAGAVFEDGKLFFIDHFLRVID
jgi:hypothetical protein